MPYPEAGWWELGKRLANAWKYRRKWSPVAPERSAVESPLCAHRALPGRHHARLLSQRELARLAHPFYHSQARGGEGHLEVGKNVYYTTRGLCHMVLALKPFGCMPSSQSDGVQSSVVNRFPEMIFLPVETSGEGEINAHSRVQMALGEARVKARAEFDAALASTGKSLAEIKDYAPLHRIAAQSVLSDSAPPGHSRPVCQLCLAHRRSDGWPRRAGPPARGAIERRCP